MRLDKLLVGSVGTLVVLVWLTRATSGPVWPVVLSVLGALVYLRTRRRRAIPAPPPVPPRPAVLIPTHNNAATVGTVVRGALASGLPVFVVDDGSGDRAGHVAEAAGATVIAHPHNRGKGAALLTGMRAAAEEGYTHVICLDADGQHDPVDIPAFAAAIRREPVAIYAGVRDLSTAPGSSRFGRRFSNFWIWVETGWRVADSQCGFRAYPLAPVLSLDLGGSRYDFEVEVLTLALWAGVPVRDLPCRVYYPPREERVSSFRPLVDNARISWMNTMLVAERILWPPRWIVRPGASRWTGASRGTSLGWRLVVAVLRRFGRGPAYLLVGGIVGWYRVFAAGPRRGLATYVAHNPAASVAGIFRRFGEALVDRFAFLLRGPGEFTYTREGEEHLVSAFEAGGAVLLSAHLGNIEVAVGPSESAERYRKVKVVRFDAEGDHARSIVAALPAEWRPDIIAVNGAGGFAALDIVREVRAGAVVAMHGDRLVDDRTVTVELFGAPCRLPAGPWLVAALARAPVVIVGAFKEGRDGYRLVAAPPMTCTFDRRLDRDAQVQAWAQAYARVLEGWARRWPDQWYNFHDLWAQEPPR